MENIKVEDIKKIVLKKDNKVEIIEKGGFFDWNIVIKTFSNISWEQILGLIEFIKVNNLIDKVEIED